MLLDAQAATIMEVGLGTAVPMEEIHAVVGVIVPLVECAWVSTLTAVACNCCGVNTCVLLAAEKKGVVYVYVCV